MRLAPDACLNPQGPKEVAADSVPRSASYTSLSQVVKNAYAKYDLSLGIGLAQINGKVFRIGERLHGAPLSAAPRGLLASEALPPRPSPGARGRAPMHTAPCRAMLLWDATARHDARAPPAFRPGSDCSQWCAPGQQHAPSSRCAGVPLTHAFTGHLGNMNELMLVSALAGAEMAMRDAGLAITPGSGVGKAIEYWHSTSKVIRTRESLLA